jgi:hypothetical protein
MRTYLVLILVTVLFYCCQKDDSSRRKNADFKVDNTWKCEIGDKQYSGTIDTSFYIFTGGSSQDTMVALTGSTSDGKAHLTIRMAINRTGRPNNLMPIGLGGDYLTFDTASLVYLHTVSRLNIVQFKVEEFTGSKLKGSFEGTLSSGNGFVQPTVKGTVSLEFGKGTNAPKFLSASLKGNHIAGPVRSATLISNTLIIDGSAFDGDTTYQLQVRTGVTIKPGVYRSLDGDVGFQLWRPSIVTHYVSDSLGDLSVTIQSVEGNIITGTFEGTAKVHMMGGPVEPITSGKFRCRVKNYVPSEDNLNQWALSLDNHGQAPFITAGGNIVEGTATRNGSLYELYLNGNTDNGRSFFRLKLRSGKQFEPGTYALDRFSDTCYLSTPLNKFYKNSSFYVRIDSISSTRLVGGFYGDILIGSELYGGGQQFTVRKGTFRTSGSF